MGCEIDMATGHVSENALLISRLRGGLSANDKEGKNTSNNNLTIILRGRTGYEMTNIYLGT